MSKKSTITKTLEINGEYTGPIGNAKGNLKLSKEEDKFPYGCRYCGRENTVSDPKHSCNRPACN